MRAVVTRANRSSSSFMLTGDLSYDFWEATLAWELDPKALKQFAMNSLRYSGMTDAEKRAAVVAWQWQWDAWLAVAARAMNAEQRNEFNSRVV